jgi:hypothetical protein
MDTVVVWRCTQELRPFEKAEGGGRIVFQNVKRMYIFAKVKTISMHSTK